jgi:hypothetical protein
LYFGDLQANWVAKIEATIEDKMGYWEARGRAKEPELEGCASAEKR